MVASVILMGAGSLVVAVLPTYATIGAAAPALLLVARLMQGFSTGGQYGAAATYLSEIAEPGRRGFYASFQFVTLIGGQLFALLVIFGLPASMSEAANRAWGWRASGRASCRERVGQYVCLSVGARSIKKKNR